MTDHLYTRQKVWLKAPDGTEYEQELEITWRQIAEHIPAKLWGPGAGPAEPAEWEIVRVE